MFGEHLLCVRQCALRFHISCRTDVIENDDYFMEPSVAQGSIYTCMSNPGRVKLFFPLLGVIFNIFIHEYGLDTNQPE